MQIDLLLQAEDAPRSAPDRVRGNTPSRINQKIDHATMKRIWSFAGQPRAAISRRIEELDREWDLERVLETNAGTLALAGIALSAGGNRRWLVLPACALALLLQHSITRKSAPVQLLRRLGIRTRREIDAEKYALRLLRGDFDRVSSASENNHKAIEALRLTRL